MPSTKLSKIQDIRVTMSSSWFKKNYTEAVGRIEDNTADEDNPYWHGPTALADAYPDDDRVLDEMGGEWTIEDARKQAFELLVLADLAEGVEK